MKRPPNIKIEAVQEFCKRKGFPVLGKEMTGYATHMIMNYEKEIKRIEREISGDQD